MGYVFPIVCSERSRGKKWLRPKCLEKRTSADKAVNAQAIYGTAEAVPFVNSRSHRLKGQVKALVLSWI